MKKRIVPFLIILLLSFFLSPFPIVWSQTNATEGNAPIFDEIAKQSGFAVIATELPNKDPREIVAKVIKIFLSLLGTIFLVLIIYGGYLWMTAQGEEEQVTKAKDLIRNAVIGLIIILAAYTITKFIFEKGGSSVGIPLR